MPNNVFYFCVNFQHVNGANRFQPRRLARQAAAMIDIIVETTTALIEAVGRLLSVSCQTALNMVLNFPTNGVMFNDIHSSGSFHFCII